MSEQKQETPRPPLDLRVEMRDGLARIICNVCDRPWYTTLASYRASLVPDQHWFLESCSDCRNMARTRRAIEAALYLREQQQREVESYTLRFPRFADYQPRPWTNPSSRAARDESEEQG